MKTLVLNLNDLAEAVHATAVEKGWWEHGTYGRPIAEQVANFHAELSEAWEEYRKGNTVTRVYYNTDNPKPEGFPIELADCIIRILDTCAAYEIDIDQAIKTKMEYNKSRPYRHGDKKA